MRTAYIGMGSNLPSPAGPPESTLAAAADRLVPLGSILFRSSLYSTRPVGYADQPRFFNAVIALETDVAPRVLLRKLLSIEHAFGRDRSTSVLNGPRTLDLDILMLGDLCLCEAGLEIPHPRLAERAFVLVPLNEIAPQAVHPCHGNTVAQMLQSLRENGEDDLDAVVQIESDSWRAGRDDAGSRTTARAGIRDLPDHGNR